MANGLHRHLVVICLIVGTVLSSTTAKGEDSLIKRFQEIFYRSDVSPEESVPVVFELLAAASKVPPSYAGSNNGPIYKTNSVPYFVGLITSKRDNPNFSIWKKYLEENIQNLPQGTLRSITALALSRMGEKNSVDDLSLLLMDVNNEVLRILAISALGKSGDRHVIPFLEAVLNGKELPAVEFAEGELIYYFPAKRAAQEALTDLGEKKASDVSMASRDEVVKRLTELLNLDVAVSLDAAGRLRQIGSPGAIEALETFVSEHRSKNPSSFVVDEVNAQLATHKKIQNALMKKRP